MMAITLVGKAMGLLRDSMQARYLGADTAESIAFAQASMLPRNFLDIMFAAAFSASFIPVFNAYMEQKGKRAAFDLAALFISVVLVLTAVVTVVSILFARPIFVLSLGDGPFPDGTVSLGVSLLIYMFPLLILSGLAFSFTGVLQSLGEFRIPAAMSVVSNGIILVYYFFFFDRFGVYGLVAAFLVGWGAQGIIQIPFLVKHKFRFRFRLDFKDPGLRQIGALALPVMAATWIVPINVMVNARASAGLYGGVFGVNAIYFAHGLYAIISGVFVLSVANVIFPKLSRQAAADDHDGFSATVNETVRVLFFFLLPLTFGVMALSRPLVGFIYGGGEFCERAVDITGTALFYFAPGILGYGLLVVLTRACYARQDGRTPIFTAVVAILVNGVLSFLLAPHMYIAGPALASAVANSVGAIILLIALTKKGVLTWSVELLKDLAKMAAFALMMFVLVVVVARVFVSQLVILQLLIPAAAGAAVYFGLSAVFRIKEMKWVSSKKP